MSSTLLLPPRAQLCNRSCSNKTHTPGTEDGAARKRRTLLRKVSGRFHYSPGIMYGPGGRATASKPGPVRTRQRGRALNPRSKEYEICESAQDGKNRALTKIISVGSFPNDPRARGRCVQPGAGHNSRVAESSVSMRSHLCGPGGRNFLYVFPIF